MKRKIIIDIDDTIFESHKLVLEWINNKLDQEYKYTYKDIIDFNFSNISKKISKDEILNFFDTEDFFQNVQIYEGFDQFIEEFKKDFGFVLLSKGRPFNLLLKRNWLQNFKQQHKKADIDLIGIGLHQSKSSVVIPNAYLAIDDYPPYLDQVVASGKILFRGDKNSPYNKVPPNTNYYVADTWNQISEMLRFDQMLSKEGIIIGE